jgi:hypothetical protein
MAIAGDRFVLGETKPVQGDCLYLALEDNQRRLKKRIDKIVQGAGAPERLELHTEWKRMDDGGLQDIEAWCKSVKEPRLIWIDTLAKIRPLAGRNEQAYTADYRAIEGLQKLSGQYQVGVVLNHHLRKASSEDDAFDDVSGTLGLTGAADTIIIMKRYAGMVKVFVRGRDIEEAEFAAEFNKDTCRWRLVGEANEVFRSEQRQAIATALKESDRSMSVSEIMAATERPDRNSTEVLLHKMERDGEVRHVGRGQWASPGLKTVKIGKKVRNGSQGADNNEENGTGESYQDLNAAETVKIAGNQDLNAAETVKIAVKIAKTPKPLANNGNASESYHLNDLNGPLRGGGTRGEGLPPGAVFAKVVVREIWPPALGPEGDDMFDIAPPRWRQ